MTPSPALRLGRTLFRLRSVTPLPVLGLLGALLWASRGEPGPGGALVDDGLDLVGLALCVFGEALRISVTGLVPEGTSGQNDRLEASVLNTRGPYAWVRNPLYLGNLLLVLGLLSIAHQPWVYAIGLGFFFTVYFFIIRAEEDFLRGRFSHAFDDYCVKVPRWVPRLSPAFLGPLREGGFDWRRALKKEHNPIAAWGTGALALLAWEGAARHGAEPRRLLLFAGLEAALLLAYLGVKGWKHR